MMQHSFTSGTSRPQQGSSSLIQVADRQHTYNAIGVSTSLSSALYAKASAQAGGSAGLSFAQQLYASASKPVQINTAQSTTSSSIAAIERQKNNVAPALPPALSIPPPQLPFTGTANDSLRSSDNPPSATEFYRIPRNSVPRPSGARSLQSNASQTSSRGAPANSRPNRGTFHVLSVPTQSTTDTHTNAISHRTQAHHPTLQAQAQTQAQTQAQVQVQAPAPAMPVHHHHHHATAPAPARSGTPRTSPNPQAVYPSPPGSASSLLPYVESPPYTPLPAHPSLSPSLPLPQPQPPSYDFMPDTPSLHSPSPTSHQRVPSSPRSRGSRSPDDSRNRSPPITRGLSAPTTTRGAGPGPPMVTTATAMSRGLSTNMMLGVAGGLAGLAAAAATLNGVLDDDNNNNSGGNDNNAGIFGLVDAFHNFSMADDGGNSNSGGGGGFGFFDQFGGDNNGGSFGQIGGNDGDSFGQFGGDGGSFNNQFGNGNGNEDGGHGYEENPYAYNPPTPSYDGVDDGYQLDPYTSDQVASPPYDDVPGQYDGYQQDQQGQNQNDGYSNSGNDWQSSNHHQANHNQHQHQTHQQSHHHSANSGPPSAHSHAPQQPYHNFQQHYSTSASQGQQSPPNAQQNSNQHYMSYSTPSPSYPQGGGASGQAHQQNAQQNVQQQQPQNTNFIPSNHSHQQFTPPPLMNSPLQQPGLGGFEQPQLQQYPHSASGSPPPNQPHRPYTTATSPNAHSPQPSLGSGGSSGQLHQSYQSQQPQYQLAAAAPGSSSHLISNPYIPTQSPVSGGGYGTTSQPQAQSYPQQTSGAVYGPIPGFGGTPTSPNASQTHSMVIGSPPHNANTYPMVGLSNNGTSTGSGGTPTSSNVGQARPHPMLGLPNNNATYVPAQYSQQTTFHPPSQSYNGSQEPPKDPETGINAQKIVQYAKTAASVAGVAVKIFQAAETLTGNNNSGSNNVFF